MTWLDIKIGAHMVGEFITTKWLEVAIGLALFGSVTYNISSDNIQASIWTVATIILIALFDVRKDILKQLDSKGIL